MLYDDEQRFTAVAVRKADLLMHQAEEYRDDYNASFRRYQSAGLALPDFSRYGDFIDLESIIEDLPLGYKEPAEAWRDMLIGDYKPYNDSLAGLFSEVTSSAIIGQSYFPWVLVIAYESGQALDPVAKAAYRLAALQATRLHWFKLVLNIRLISGLHRLPIGAIEEP